MLLTLLARRKDGEDEDDDTCHYSTVQSKTCRTDEDGKYVCDTVKKIIRRCAGRKPEEIERVTETEIMDKPPEVGAWDVEVGRPQIPFFPPDAGRSLLEEFERNIADHLEAVFGGPRHGTRRDERPKQGDSFFSRIFGRSPQDEDNDYANRFESSPPHFDRGQPGPDRRYRQYQSDVQDI